MVALASPASLKRVLEPSCGEGVFIRPLLEAGAEKIYAFEVDESLKKEEGGLIRYESFISAKLDSNVTLAIGNPPYVRWKHLPEKQKLELKSSNEWNRNCNSLSDYLYPFIIKSITHLDPGGELIFITPDYWLNTKHAKGLRRFILEHCQIDSIYYFGEARIFKGIASSFIIFKLTKARRPVLGQIQIFRWIPGFPITEPNLQLLLTNIDSVAESYRIPHFDSDNEWSITGPETSALAIAYESRCTVLSEHVLRSPVRLMDIADIGNGLVSGLDKAFQIPIDYQLTPVEAAATVDVTKAKNLKRFFTDGLQRYIFIRKSMEEEEFRREYPNFNNHLLPYLEALKRRYNYKRDIKYWEWVFPRSLRLFDRDCKKLFVPCKERITKHKHIRFSLVEPHIYPTQDVTGIVINSSLRENIYYFLALLNTKMVFDWLMCNGSLKGGIFEFSEAPLSRIPIRLIDWRRDSDVELHNKISRLSEAIVVHQDLKNLQEIEDCFTRLLG